MYSYVEDAMQGWSQQWRKRDRFLNGSSMGGDREVQQCQWLGKPACLGKISASAASTPYPRFALAFTGEQPPTEWENFLQKSGCQGLTETEIDRAAQLQNFLQGRGLRVLYLRGHLQEEQLIFADGTSLARSRLQELITQATEAQQLILLEDTGNDPTQRQPWLNDLLINKRREAQTIIVSPSQETGESLLKTVSEIISSQSQVTDADLLDELNSRLEEQIKWGLSGDRGFIEIVPKSPPSQNIQLWRSASRRIFTKYQQATTNSLTQATINSNQFVNPDNPTLSIYSQMLDQGCTESPIVPLRTLEELNFYWDTLRRDSSFTPVLIFYQNPSIGNPQDFSDTFLGAMRCFEGYICFISDRPEIPQ